MTDELITWLREQVAEDERVARAATQGPWSWQGDSFDGDAPYCPHGSEWCDHGPDLVSPEGYVVTSSGYDASHLSIGRGDAEHIARHDPARVLAEVAAKRRIIDEYDWSTSGPPSEDELGLGRAVRLLASVYAGRPGWRPEWAPDEKVNHA